MVCKSCVVALGASDGQVQEFAPKISQYMDDSYHPKSIVPEDVLQLLPQLQQAGYSMAVISDREKPYQQEIESLGIASYFVFSHGGRRGERVEART